MCRHITLYYQENTGNVVKCITCHKIQVSFNVVSITFDETGFEHFRKNIANTLCSAPPGIDKRAKSVRIPSPCEGMSLLLSLSELETLHTILEEADNELKAQSLLMQFQLPE